LTNVTALLSVHAQGEAIVLGPNRDSEVQWGLRLTIKPRLKLKQINETTHKTVISKKTPK